MPLALLSVLVTAEKSLSTFIGVRSSGPPSADQSVFLSTRPPETVNLAPELTVAKDFKVLEQLHPMLLAAHAIHQEQGLCLSLLCQSPVVVWRKQGAVVLCVFPVHYCVSG